MTAKTAPTADEWTSTTRPSRHGRPEIEHRRQVGRLELLVEFDPDADDPGVYWHVRCGGNAILCEFVGSARRDGAVEFLMARGRRAAEEAVGIGAMPGSNPRDATPLRLHPDDIAAIIDRLAHVLAPKEQS